MHRVLHNPFLDRLIDVGHEPIVEGLRQLADGLLGGTAFLPPAWPAPSPTAQPPPERRSSAGGSPSAASRDGDRAQGRGA